MKYKIIFSLIFISILSCIYGILYIDDYSTKYNTLLVQKDYIITGSYDAHEYEYFPNLGSMFAKITLFFNFILLVWWTIIAYFIVIKKSASKHLKIQTTILLFIVITISIWSIAFGVGATYSEKRKRIEIEREIKLLKKEEN
jgi:hypothetical protein